MQQEAEMTMKIGMSFVGRTAGVAALLATGLAVCWPQQKGSSNVQAAAPLLQQQQAAAQKSLLGQASTPSPTMRQPNGTVSSVPLGDDPLFTLGDSLRAKRNDERQKRLESDTQRLLTLANQLKSEVGASGAESMTPEMLRQMDEIEKLAKSVKDKMRN